MDRFFSKLDLRDIKIDPFNTSFPPDAEDAPADEPDAHAHQPLVGDPVPPAREARQRHVPAWANGVEEASTGVETARRREVEKENGHAVEDVTVATAVVRDPSTPRLPDAAEALPGGEDVLKVSARSRPSAVAGAIAGVVRENGRAEVQAIGAGATNQAIKAVAIARDYLRETGIEAVCLPAFIDVTIENEERTAIRLVVEPR